MPKILILTSCFILSFITQSVQSTPVGAVDKLEGEWIIQKQRQISRTFTAEDHKLKMMPLYTGDQYTLKSTQGYDYALWTGCVVFGKCKNHPL